MILRLYVNADEITLLREALDSHAYWHVCEPHQRNDGAPAQAAYEDRDVAPILKRIENLDGRLHALQREGGAVIG